MKQSIEIKTEANLCGDEYLNNGTLTLSTDNSYIVILKDDNGFECHVDIRDLQVAVNKLS